MQSTRTTNATPLHAGWPGADARHRQPPGTVTANGVLSSHRIAWLDGDGNHARDRGDRGLQRVWIALGALTRHHRGLATVVMATAMSLPLGLAGAVLLVRGGPQLLTPVVALAIAASGVWLGTCCLFYVDHCRPGPSDRGSSA